MAIDKVLQGDARFLFSKHEVTDEEFLESLNMQPPAVKGKTEIELEDFDDEDRERLNGKALFLQSGPFNDRIR